MPEPQMNNYQRAAQFWAVLVCAARNRQVLTYEMMNKATGMAQFGLNDVLAIIVQYCSSKGWPKLTTILVRAETCLPADEVDDPKTVCAHHAKVFDFNWFDRVAPSPQDLRESDSSRHSAAHSG